MFQLSNFNGTIRVLMIILLVPIISIGAILFQTKNDIEDAKHNHAVKEAEINEMSAELIKEIILDKSALAKKNTELVKNEIIFNFRQEYGEDLDRLRVDLHSSVNNPAKSILNKSIEGRFMFVKNYNNRMWIASNDGIIADRNMVTANGKLSRTWEEEYKHSVNENLLRNAVNMLTNKVGGRLIYIDGPFMDWDYPTDEIYSTSSMNNIMEIFALKGKNGINKYNIIEKSYIYDTEDIFGVPDVDHNGIKTNNDILIVVQQYSLGDALDEHSTIFKEYDHMKQTNDDQFEAYCITTFNRMIINVAIMILSFIAILGSVSLYRNWGDWQHGSNAS